MKVAIISNYAPPDKSAAVTRILSLADFLKTKNIEALILTPNKEELHRGEKDARVHRYCGLLDLIKKTREQQLDVLIATTPPATTSFQAVLAGKINKIPVVVDIRDPWTSEEAAVGVIRKNSFTYWRNHFMENASYRLASKIFVVSEYLREEIIRLFRIKEEKFVVVPNGADTKIFNRNEEEGKTIRKKLGIPDNSPVIVYEGILGGKELDKFLTTCGKEAVDEYGAHFLFAAIIDRFSQNIAEQLKKIAEEKGFQKNLHLIGPIELKEIPKYLSAGDIALNPLPNERRYCIPVKTYEYMACGLPVACKAAKDGGLWKFMEKNPYGFCAESWEEFKKLFMENLRQLDDLKKKAAEAPEIIEKEYSRKKANETALEEINKLIKK